MLGSDYYLAQLLFYNYRLLLNKDQEIKVFQKVSMYKFIQQIINSRQWIDILLCLPIQCMIINNHS